MKIARVVVTGGRKFTDGARLEADLRAMLPFGLMRVAHGGARGADAAADAAARRVFPAEIFQRGGGGVALYEVDQRLDGRWPVCGPRRNRRMLEAEKPDLVLAYPDPDSRGTWHCVREACRRGITTAVWAPFVEMYEFMGEDEFKPGIYVDGPAGHILRIDDQRRESHGRASDGGWASLVLFDDQPRFLISTFDASDDAERLAEVLRAA